MTHTISKTTMYKHTTMSAAVAMDEALAALAEYLRYNFKSGQTIQLKLKERIVEIDGARGATCTITVRGRE